MWRFQWTLVCAFIAISSWQHLAVGVPHPPTTSAPLVGSTYDTKFDNVDLDEILGQERLLTNYVKCLEGVGPCTPDAKMLKEVLPDAVTTDCAHCSARQKYGAQKVTHYLIDHRPDDWSRLELMYDPTGSFRTAYLAEQKATAEAAAAAMSNSNAVKNESMTMTTKQPETPTPISTTVLNNENGNA